MKMVGGVPSMLPFVVVVVADVVVACTALMIVGLVGVGGARVIG